MKGFLFVAILLLALPSKAQIFFRKVNNFTRDSQIDTFLVYSYECYPYGEYLAGEYIPRNSQLSRAKIEQPVDIKDCTYYNTAYVFWKKGSKTLMQRFERCNDFDSIELGEDNPLTFFLSNREVIDKENIKVFATVDPTCDYVISFYSKGKTNIYREASHAFFPGLGQRINSYYEYNTNSKLKALIDKVELLITP